MALDITNKQGIYELKGDLHGKNALSLLHHFEKLLISSETIVLSLDHVSSIDACGIRTLTKLYRSAVKENKIFYLIGSDNRAVTNAFCNKSYMLRNDFL